MQPVRAHELFPDGRFSAPASEAEIAAAERQLGVRLPEQLRRLYLECDGFREDRGNARYLLPLSGDTSLLGITHQMWDEVQIVDLHAFVFFGLSGGDDLWGIAHGEGNKIIAYHHNMEDRYVVVGTEILDVYRADYAAYDAAAESQ